jgi:hypothetical protein
MESRLRQIMEEQIPYRGQSEYYDDQEEYYDGGACYDGGATKKKTTRRKKNPWVVFLKYVSEKCKIPYGELIANEKIREVYHKYYGAIKGRKPAPVKGSGAFVGGAKYKNSDVQFRPDNDTCWNRFRADVKSKKQNTLKQSTSKATRDKRYLGFAKKNCYDYDAIAKRLGSKTTRKKAPAKKAPVRKAPAKKAPAKKAPVRKAKVFDESELPKSVSGLRKFLKECIGQGYD